MKKINYYEEGEELERIKNHPFQDMDFDDGDKDEEYEYTRQQ